MEFREAYQGILLREFEKRRRNNSAYSLRAYSRDIHVQTSKLSEILSGKKGLSRDRAEMIAEKLRLNRKEAELFVMLVVAAHGRSEKARSEAIEKLESDRLAKSALVDLEKFRTISSWYHFAILELTHTGDFQLDARWISQRLQISDDLALQAIRRLLRAGLLDDSSGKWKAQFEHFETNDDISSEAIREHHHQVISLGQQKLDQLSTEMREFQTVMISVSEDSLPDAKQRIRDFLDRFINEFNVPDGAERVFALGVQYFPLDRPPIGSGRE